MYVVTNLNTLNLNTTFFFLSVMEKLHLSPFSWSTKYHNEAEPLVTHRNHIFQCTKFHAKHL
jgi:hypothetical protein